ncbi:MAG: RIP metalloprotease RseP [Spirosomataceae bacterium]
MDALVMTGQLLLALAILVTLHEFGHYITARWFGIRVEKFYLFFDFLFPLPHIWNFALFKKKVGDTEYGVGWFPLGGYVKIAGMIDESMDEEFLKSTPKPDEFRSKPAWQRLIVMLGGIIVNVILGILIFIGISYKNGNNYLSASEVNKYGIVAKELGKEIGLKTGDKILKVNGKPFERFDDLTSPDVLLGSNSYYTIERDGKQVDVFIPNNLVEKLSDRKNPTTFIEPIMPFKIGEIAPDSPAEKAGLKVNDRIVSLNGQPIQFFHEFKEKIVGMGGKTATLGVLRNGQNTTISVPVSKDGTIGFYQESLLNFTHNDYTFGEAIAVGTNRAFSVVTDNIKGFGKIFKGEVSASKALSGPVGIARMFGGIWDWNRFWALTGLLSMVLAFMNALPIPALDGGHAVILLYEMITRRTPSDKALEIVQQIGMILILGLMAFALGNDIFKAIF